MICFDISVVAFKHHHREFFEAILLNKEHLFLLTYAQLSNIYYFNIKLRTSKKFDLKTSESKNTTNIQCLLYMLYLMLPVWMLNIYMIKHAFICKRI